jgi:hypothetical protein
VARRSRGGPQATLRAPARAGSAQEDAARRQRVEVVSGASTTRPASSLHVAVGASTKHQSFQV